MASCCSDRLNKWKKRCPTAANQLRNVCRRKHWYFRHYEVNTWTYMFFYFSRNTKKKLVPSIETWTLLCKNRSLAIETLTCVIRETAGYQTKTSLWICTLPAETCLIMVTSLTITNENAKITLYQWKVTICWTQHHISIETVKRYLTQIKNSLTVPCWHHVRRESRRKALWVNMAALCAKRPRSQNRCLSPGSAIFRS